MTVRLILAIAALSWALLLASVGFFIYDGAQRDTAIERQGRAHCAVLSVLLGNRADRDETIKLFDPIRRENPKQFDKLVKKAERGDKRLEQVQGDLACSI